MVPQVAEDRSSLRAELLPRGFKNTELNYRLPIASRMVPPVPLLLASSLAASAASLVLRPLFWLQTATLQLVILLTIALILAGIGAHAMLRRRADKALFSFAAIPAVFLFLTVHVSCVAHFFLLLIATAFVAFLCQLAVSHAAAWHSAEMSIPTRLRRAFLAVWIAPFWKRVRRPANTGSAVREREMPERTAY